MKPRFRLRLVGTIERQPPARTMTQKREDAINWLRSRNRYILDANATRPTWGIPYAQQEESPLMKSVMEADRRRK